MNFIWSLIGNKNQKQFGRCCKRNYSKNVSKVLLSFSIQKWWIAPIITRGRTFFHECSFKIDIWCLFCAGKGPECSLPYHFVTCTHLYVGRNVRWLEPCSIILIFSQVLRDFIGHFVGHFVGPCRQFTFGDPYVLSNAALVMPNNTSDLFSVTTTQRQLKA